MFICSSSDYCALTIEIAAKIDQDLCEFVYLLGRYLRRRNPLPFVAGTALGLAYIYLGSTSASYNVFTDYNIFKLLNIYVFF